MHGVFLDRGSLDCGDLDLSALAAALDRFDDHAATAPGLRAPSSTLPSTKCASAQYGASCTARCALVSARTSWRTASSDAAWLIQARA